LEGICTARRTLDPRMSKTHTIPPSNSHSNPTTNCETRPEPSLQGNSVTQVTLVLEWCKAAPNVHAATLAPFVVRITSKFGPQLSHAYWVSVGLNQICYFSET